MNRQSIDAAGHKKSFEVLTHRPNHIKSQKFCVIRISCSSNSLSIVHSFSIHFAMVPTLNVEAKHVLLQQALEHGNDGVFLKILVSIKALIYLSPLVCQEMLHQPGSIAFSLSLRN